MKHGEKIIDVKPMAMVEIDKDSACAIARDEAGRTQMIYCRQVAGNEKEFFGSIIPEAEGKNVIQQNPEERELVSHKVKSPEDLSKMAGELETAKEREKQGVPSGEEGIQIEEINGTVTQNREKMLEGIREDLYKRKGLVEKAKGAMPGYLEYMEKQIDEEAKEILKLLEADEDLSYEEAIRRVEAQKNRDEGGRTPDQNNRRREF